MKNNQDIIKLHLGCGKRYLPGFVHIDIEIFPHIDFISDIKDLSIFANNSVDLIYSCGVFEYFDKEEVPTILNEWKRVLKPGGNLKISVPNFQSIIKIYKINGKNLEGEGILGPLFGRIKINTKKGKELMYHKTVYDYESLKKLLIKKGFVNIKKYNPHKFLPDDFDDYSKAYFPYKDQNGVSIHLNLEAEKL